MDTSSEQLPLARQLVMQVFPQARSVEVSKVPEGVSTWVYRISCDQTAYYLRVLPEENASFAPEVYIHDVLRARGLRVPEIIYFEEYNEALQRSVVVTTAIGGEPVGRADPPERFASVLRQAGRELALLNQLPVDGFGWIVREGVKQERLCGEYPTFMLWMTAEIEAALSAFARQEYSDAGKVALLERILTQAIEQVGSDSATLAHGDFDVTHIFHNGDEYCGMIDFGEIRGTNRFYDLGHFAIENQALLPNLVEGYGEITSLPPDYTGQIRQMALLIAVARSGRRVARGAATLEVDRALVHAALDGASFS